MLCAGCDWADRWVDVAVVDDTGTVVAEKRINYAAENNPVAEYRALLASLSRRWRATVKGSE